DADRRRAGLAQHRLSLRLESVAPRPIAMAEGAADLQGVPAAAGAGVLQSGPGHPGGSRLQDRESRGPIERDPTKRVPKGARPTWKDAIKQALGVLRAASRLALFTKQASRSGLGR